MKTKKSVSLCVLAGIVFCVLYVLLAVRPLGKEYYFSPLWKTDVNSPVISENTEENPVFPFKLGQKLGYFTEDGKITNFVTFPQKATVSATAYSVYNTNSTSAKVFAPDGTELFTINKSGFPMIDQDRFFLFLPGGSSLVMYDKTGKQKWEYSGTMPITAFDSSENAVALGFADGSIKVFSTDGSELTQFTPGGSNIPVVLGIAISKSGDYVAAICGQNRKRFVLAKNDDGKAKILYHEFIESSSPLQTLVKFTQDESTVYFNYENTLGIVDVHTGKRRTVKTIGQILKIQENDNSAFVLSKTKNTYNIASIEKFATLTGSFSFTAKNAFIQLKGNKLYIGKDDSISCILIERK